jgi:hypothetical protein
VAVCQPRGPTILDRRSGFLHKCVSGLNDLLGSIPN